MQTLRDIQFAALQLARDSGFAHVTTEMIAARAGISCRTFFNYFPNKQAAVIGAVIRLDPALKARFLAGEGDFLTDLGPLLRGFFHDIAARKATTRAIGELIAIDPQLREVFFNSFGETMADLRELFLVRPAQGDEMLAEILAELISHALGQTFIAWAHDEDLELEVAVDQLFVGLRRLGAVLLGG